MRDDEAAFVDAMGQLMSAYGLGPMAGRVWAWLLICDPPEKTAAELADSLKASRGAISGAAAFLAAARLIRRMRRRGDRREYFSVPPGAFDSLLRSGTAYYEQLAEITASGLATIGHRDPAGRVRLQEVHDAVMFINGSYPAALEQYLRDRTPAASAVPADIKAVEAKEIPA
jgi:DNA-binding MarR family transcriptional regulator